MVEKKKNSESKEKKTVVSAPLEKDSLNENSSHKVPKSVVSLRGRKFEGVVIRKFDNRITIEFERAILNKKYERYSKRKTKMHAKVLESMKEEIMVGDYVQIQECRPLSKILHHVFVKKIRGVNEK